LTGIKFLDIRQFTAKIGYQNTRSFELFKKLGFVEVLHMMLTSPIYMNILIGYSCIPGRWLLKRREIDVSLTIPFNTLTLLVG